MAEDLSPLISPIDDEPAPPLIPFRVANATTDAPDQPASGPELEPGATLAGRRERARELVGVVLTTAGVLAGTAGATMVAVPLGLAVLAVCLIALGLLVILT